jgi:NAD(P)-dependent dehydrogenase (short-subunit alcohol dehydrogenase family)
LAVAAAAAAFYLARRPRYDFAGKVALVTGGSRGLGLVLARQLLDAGAAVALMARDADELTEALQDLDIPERVITVVGDVRRSEDATRAVRRVMAEFGRLDILINNAGQIVSAPFEATPLSDFTELFDVHALGTIRMSRAALPVLTRPQGRIVNICSIGGRIPVPHLAAYCASKSAQASVSAIMAAELAGDGVVVCTVSPGLMRTGSHLHARFRGDAAGEFRAFALSAGLPGISMSAERAARLILHEVRRGTPEVIVPWTIRQAARAYELAPSTAVRVMQGVTQWLPNAHGPTPATAGADLPLSPVVRKATHLNERAADRNNER